MHVKALVSTAFILALVWVMPLTSEGNTVMLFDCKEIGELAHTGITVSESAKYSVWVWARNGSSFSLKIGDAGLDVRDFSPSKPYSWGKIGEVELQADQEYSFQLDTEKAIGWLAISPSDFNPKRASELMYVNSDRPGPVRDDRVREKRHTTSAFRFPEYKTAKEWQDRRADIRRKILVSAGLWPMPEKCPLNVKIVDKLDRDGYTIEKLYMEMLPGFYIPGALYRPKDKEGPLPVIINPHGHGKLGRMSENVQARCANFALQGYIAFSYNMIGYVDNDQMDHNFQSDPAYLWSISIGGLQLWQSIRALDFVTSLPNVDLEKVVCTGCSGGGSQTFLVNAVDDRIKVAAPVCMVSSLFQGGCICENAPGLRLDTYNVEISACGAPRPQILVAATGDWTDMTPEIEFPDVRSIYSLSGDEGKLSYYYQDAGHNYNQNSREAVYSFFRKWVLGVNDDKEQKEVETPVEPVETLRVFDDAHPRPDDALDQDGIVKSIVAQAEETLVNIWPTDEAGLAKFRETMSPALADVMNVKQPEDVYAEIMPLGSKGLTIRDKYTVARYIITRPGEGDQIPAILYSPKRGNLWKTANLVVHPEGKAALVDFASGEPGDFVKAMLENDQMVLAIDAFLTGEHHSPFEETQREQLGRYFTTFNPVDESLRVQDILTAVTYLQGREDVDSVNLVGMGEAGLWCLLANAFASDLKKTVVDVVEFDNHDESMWVEHLNIPGILRVGGFETAIACAAPRPLLIHNTANAFNTARVAKLYEILKTSDKLKVNDAQETDQAILSWLAKP